MYKVDSRIYQGDSQDAISHRSDSFFNYIIYLGQKLPEELSYDSVVPIIHYPLSDDGNNSLLKLSHIISLVRNLQSPLLICCRAGMSRSASICAYSANLDYDLYLKINPTYLPHPDLIKSIEESLIMQTKIKCPECGCVFVTLSPFSSAICQNCNNKVLISKNKITTEVTK